MTEKNLQTLFKKYIETYKPQETEVYEFKICKNRSFPFDRVADHQIASLLEVQNDGFYHKIIDQPVSWGMKTKIRFTAKKPFDAFFAKSMAYIILWFYVPREKKIFYKIKIEDFLQLRNSCGRKSATEEMIEKISEKIII
jgi:hypothetical protein